MITITREQRIAKVVKTIKSILSDLSDKQLKVVMPLAERIAFMQITLEDLEADINENGSVELFSQSPNTPPYERERPSVRMYNSIISNYNKSCKQLQDMIPANSDDSKKKAGDELIAFLSK